MNTRLSKKSYKQNQRAGYGKSYGKTCGKSRDRVAGRRGNLLPGQRKSAWGQKPQARKVARAG